MVFSYMQLMLLVGVSLSLIACGARSALAVDAALGPRQDALSMSDATAAPDAALDAPSADIAAPRDLGVVDTGARCALRVRSGPTTVHEESGGYFVAPALTHRSTLDAVATFIAVIDDRVSHTSVRSAQIGRDGTLTLGPRVTLLAAEAAVPFASSGSMLGGCFLSTDRGGTSSLTLGRWSAYEPLPAITLATPAGGCLGLGNTVGPWFVLYRSDSTSASEAMFRVFSEAGSPLGAPRSALQRTPSSGRAVAFAEVGRGFAWASGADPRGAIEVGLLLDGDERHSVLWGFSGTLLPGVGPWYTEATLAVAGFNLSQLVVSVITRDGTEVARNPSLDFVMFGDSPPAVAIAPFGVLVAVANFGDANPSAGRLSVFLLDQRANVVGAPLHVPIQRPVTLPRVEIAMETVVDQVVLHWTGARGDNLNAAQTSAMVIDCR